MSRAARHLAVGFLAAWGLVAGSFVAVGAGLVAGGTGEDAVDRLGVLPNGVWLAVPVGFLAALSLVVHLRRSGALRALAVGGAHPVGQTSGVGLLAAVVLAASGLLLPGSVPGPVHADDPWRPRVAVDGSLALGERVTWWVGEAAPRPVAPDTRFVDRPRHPTRFRLRLLLARPPWAPTAHPLDPTGARWMLLVALGIALPWWLCALALRGRFGWT